MKKLFLCGLVAVMMAACTNDEVWNEDNGSGEVAAERYMSISLVANNPATRADATTVYANGDADEYAVAGGEYIVFYFFDAGDNSFGVNADGDNYLVPKSFATTADGEVVDATDVNFVEQDDGGSVSSISNLILVFRNQSGSTPSKVVALVNAPTAYQKSYATLSALQKDLVVAEGAQNALKGGDTQFFMMSNSAYQDAQGDNVYATPIESKNLASSISQAAENPVQIYVERVDAKVSVKLAADQMLSDGKLYIDVTVPGIEYADNSEAPAIKARIEGWSLFNKAQQAYLIKNIEGINTWYNDTPNFRSYWANTSDASIGTTMTTYNDTRFADETTLSHYREYVLENTGNDNADPYTSIIFAATLGTTDTEGTFEPLTLCLWLSKHYTKEQLCVAMANYLSHELYSFEVQDEGTQWNGIAVEDIAFAVAEDGYHVYPTLSETGLAKSWASARNTANKIDSEQANEILAKVPKAQIWEEGMCYYFARITHSGADGRVPGVVRNHWYQVTVNGVKGLGTAVYDPDQSFDPVTPSSDGEDTWYLDATINVQSWKIEGVGITLGETE